MIKNQVNKGLLYKVYRIVIKELSEFDCSLDKFW